MAETIDAQLEQIEKKVQREREATRSEFAFSGFGRSTDLAGAIQKVDGFGAKMVKTQSQITSAEGSLMHYYRMAAMYDVDNSDAIGRTKAAIANMRADLQKLEQEQQGRLGDISQRIFNQATRFRFSRDSQQESRYTPRRRKAKKLQFKQFKDTQVTKFKSLANVKPYKVSLHMGRLTKLSSLSSLKPL